MQLIERLVKHYAKNHHTREECDGFKIKVRFLVVDYLA